MFWPSGIPLFCLGVPTANADLVTNVKAPFVWIPQMLLFLKNEKWFYGQFSWCWFLKQIKHGNSRGKNQRCLSYLIQTLGWSYHPELDFRSMIPFLCRMKCYRLTVPGEKASSLLVHALLHKVLRQAD